MAPHPSARTWQAAQAEPQGTLNIQEPGNLLAQSFNTWSGQVGVERLFVLRHEGLQRSEVLRIFDFVPGFRWLAQPRRVHHLYFRLPIEILAASRISISA